MFRKKKNIIDFFNVSIIMPFYKRLDDFKRVLPENAKYFERNGIEIVIILDYHKEEKGLLELIKNYPFINFKIIINRKEHEWRNPCKVLNVGIRNASFDYILVLDPEVELITDVIYQLRYTLYNYPLTYATGVVAFISHGEDIHNIKNPTWMSYGSIMAAKEDLFKVRGYDEIHNEWGGEDDQIRRKLDLLGLKKMEVIDAKTVHRENNSDRHRERTTRLDTMPIRHLKNILYPYTKSKNVSNWGKDFNEIIWYWKVDKSYVQLKKYLSQFEECYKISQKKFRNKFEVITLIQIRNESKNIPKVLKHLSNYCDGIILLDDGSTDGSYKKALDEKLLAKVKKQYKGYFDDLENRNTLLKIANFFKSEWFIFIDADERFDSRYSNIREHINNQKFDVYRFHLVDVWDNPEKYRVDIPDRNQNGITTRARMFRNKGSMQIHTNREIHFPAVPYSHKVKNANILLLHYGNFDKKIRKRKYNLYKSQDPDEKKLAHSYEFLKDKNVILKSLKSIKLNKI